MSFRFGVKDSLASGSLAFFLSVFSFLQFFTYQVSWANGEDQAVIKVPSLEDTINLALKYNSGKAPNETIYEVKEAYYLIQQKYEQLKVSDEVKGHFETAIEKAEEKMESDEADVTQSEITKLKLGLAGALSDIIKYQSESLRAKLTLGKLLGTDVPPVAELTEKRLVQLKLPYKTLDAYLQLKNQKPTASGQLRKRMSDEKMLLIKNAFITLLEKGGLAALARKNRRMTRALLVTEVANYDFGIGDSADLFEALIIYTRLLNGFHKTVYGFNLAVADLDQIYSN